MVETLHNNCYNFISMMNSTKNIEKEGYINMKFEEKLMQLRKEKKISQEELGNELNVTRQTISKWELGQSKPDMGKLVEISRFFNVDVNTLTDEFSEINNDDIMTGGVNNTDDFLNSSSQYNPNYYNQDKKSNIKEILLIVLIGIIIVVLIGAAIYWVIDKVKDAKAEKEAEEKYEEVMDYKDKIFEEHEKMTNTIVDVYKDSASKITNDTEDDDVKANKNEITNTLEEMKEEIVNEVTTNSSNSSSSVDSYLDEAYKNYEEHAEQVEEMQEEMYKQLDEMKNNREEMEKMFEDMNF